MAKVREELAELEEAPADRLEEELGDVLFAVAALARRLSVDPETALRNATRRFGERFDRMRAEAVAADVDLETLSEKDLLARFRAAR